MSGRAEGTRTSGVFTRVRSALPTEAEELFGGVTSEPEPEPFLLMLSARTPPSCAVLRIELAGLRPGIAMRIGFRECFESMEGTGGVSDPGVSAGLLVAVDLTLTTAAFPRTTVWAGRGETMAFWRYIVDATLPRCATLGATLLRAAVLDDIMESRKSGTKKCWSALEYGLLMPDEGDMAGIGGTGGTSRSGDPGPERLVTPGI